MEENKALTLMIHDLNPWGGQDRSMLEIAWQLNKQFPLEIHSYSLQGYDNWPDMEHIPYKALIKKPILLKYLHYHISSWKKLSAQKNPVVQSTGTASLKSHVVQVQFIHHSWQKVARTLPPDKQSSSSLLQQGYHRFLNLYKKELEKRVYTPDKYYIAISHSIKKELMEHFSIPPNHIEIIHHGVDPQYFCPWQEQENFKKTRDDVRQSLGIDPHDRVLLHVGALNARKGLFQSLEVLGYMKKQGLESIKYLAVGQGDPKILQQQIKKYDLEKEVILAPHSKDIRTYYWAADLFFFPSFYEPFGLVILEAMACGLPVVASEWAGGSELIEEGQNGLLFNPLAPSSEIANTLLPLLRHENLRQQIGRAGRRTALKRSWQTVGEEYRQFYENPPWKTQA